MNYNTEYEKFTQEIYQSLIKAEGIDIIEVKHNIKIEGKSGQSHQIDVYWQYEIAGVKHKVVIECKNYNQLISIGKVRDFHSVLADIGNINGIIVTKEGYQKGSKIYATHYGINLIELRMPKEEDWEGRIKTIELSLMVISRSIKKRSINLDEQWIKDNVDLSANGDFNYSVSRKPDEIWIFDEHGSKLKNIHQLDHELPHNNKTENDLDYTYHFEDGYIKVGEFDKMKIKSIHYNYDVNTGTDKFIINGSDAAKAILKDAISGEIKFFNKDGSVK